MVRDTCRNVAVRDTFNDEQSEKKRNAKDLKDRICQGMIELLSTDLIVVVMIYLRFSDWI